jgi:hypothetical protein
MLEQKVEHSSSRQIFTRFARAYFLESNSKTGYELAAPYFCLEVRGSLSGDYRMPVGL